MNSAHLDSAPAPSAAVPEPAEARRRGLRSIAIGLGVVAITNLIVVIASATGARSVALPGAGFLLGGIIAGFGLGDVLFAGRLRIVTMLLALLVGIAGIVFNFWMMKELGFRVTASS